MNSKFEYFEKSSIALLGREMKQILLLTKRFFSANRERRNL